MGGRVPGHAAGTYCRPWDRGRRGTRTRRIWAPRLPRMPRRRTGPLLTPAARPPSARAAMPRGGRGIMGMGAHGGPVERVSAAHRGGPLRARGRPGPVHPRAPAMIPRTALPGLAAYAALPLAGPLILYAGGRLDWEGSLWINLVAVFMAFAASEALLFHGDALGGWLVSGLVQAAFVAGLVLFWIVVAHMLLGILDRLRRPAVPRDPPARSCRIRRAACRLHGDDHAGAREPPPCRGLTGSRPRGGSGPIMRPLIYEGPRGLGVVRPCPGGAGSGRRGRPRSRHRCGPRAPAPGRAGPGGHQHTRQGLRTP